MNQPVSWMDGRLVPERDAALALTDRGLLMGDGLYAAMRAYAGQVFRLERHLARLESGADALRIPLPLSPEAIEDAVHETLAANDLRDAGVRITLTRGAGPTLDLPEPAAPLLFITTHPIRADVAGRPCTGHLVSFPRNERSPLVGLQTLSHLECILAREEARSAGADEGLFRNTRGNLTEGAGSNLFFVRGGVVMTPDEESGLLPGITRETILELARGLGIPLRVSPVSLMAMRAASEAFLTSAFVEVAPLVSVDGTAVGSGQPGPVTLRLAAAYRECVGRET